MLARPPTANAIGFDDHFEQSRTNIFRLETLQNYGNSGEDPALAAFLAGQPHLLTPAKHAWTALVRDRTATGCVMQRVHMITEPITDYLRFELTWGYQPNVEAGEDIRIIPVAVGQQWPPELPKLTDFWLFDLSVLYGRRPRPSPAAASGTGAASHSHRRMAASDVAGLSAGRRIHTGTARTARSANHDRRRRSGSGSD
jgi:hypothetical protein